MKEHILRIMKLVEQGKLNPEDAADLIDALETAEPEKGSKETKAAEEQHNRWDKIKSVFDTIEASARSSVSKVDWKKVSDDIRNATQQGITEAAKAFEQIQKSEFWAKVNLKGSFQEKRREDLAFNIQPGKLLKIDNPIGNIVITGGAEQAKINAEVEVRAVSREKAVEKINSWSLLIEETENGASIRVPQQNDEINTSVDLKISIPEGVNAHVVTTSGDINIAKTMGAVELVTLKGDAEVENVRGTCRFNLTKGDIVLKDADVTSVLVETRSGDIKIVNSKGNINLRSANGDIKAVNIHGSEIDAETVSGDISLLLSAPVEKRLYARTVNGDVSVKSPDGGNCRLNLGTVAGSVECSLPATNIEKGDKYWQGTCGNGNGLFEVSAVRGDVNVSLADANSQN